jgi:hypothetical protein
MRKAYAAGGMIVRTATRGGGGGGGGANNGNSKGGSNSSKQVDEPNSGAGVPNSGGGSGSSSSGNKSPGPESSSPVVVTKTDPALLGAIKSARIRGRNQQVNPQQQQQRHHHQQHNQPPPDVMNLTAKNYRLAKELVSPMLHRSVYSYLCFRFNLIRAASFLSLLFPRAERVTGSAPGRVQETDPPLDGKCRSSTCSHNSRPSTSSHPLHHADEAIDQI